MGNKIRATPESRRLFNTLNLKETASYNLIRLCYLHASRLVWFGTIDECAEDVRRMK